MAWVFKWTAEIVDYLRELHDAGATASKSAEAIMGRFGGTLTRNAVIGKWQRLGLCNSRVKAPANKPKADKPPKPGAEKAPAPVALVAPTFSRNPEPLIAIPVSGRVALSDLRETHCRFPLGDPRNAEFGFCGAFAPIGAPYCAEHHALCYRPIERSVNRKFIAAARRAA